MNCTKPGPVKNPRPSAGVASTRRRRMLSDVKFREAGVFVGNMLFRRVAAGAAAATVAVGLSTMLASPASAHASGATGSAECVSVDGKYQITWTLTNDYN